VRARPGVPGLAFVDFLANLLLVFTVLFILSFVLIQPRAAPPALRTAGLYAVQIAWRGDVDDDVDMYVRDPQQNVVYFGNPNAGLLHLEHDDLGYPSAASATGRFVKPRTNEERVVLRGVEPGEFIVNVHLYREGGTQPVRVRASLWKLIGSDKPVATAVTVLRYAGEEKTAFRFTVTPGSAITNVNRLPMSVMRAAVGTAS
jgi:hypothetical protein